VGANGRMGSLLLSKTARAVPRGVAPGCLSPIGTPIYVATPARVWSDILHQTLTERKEDLVWIGNGLPPPTVTTTVVVPHFGVLERYGDPVTSPTSPSTLIYGKHAVAVENLLRRKGIHNVQLVSSYDDILIAAARKLLWAASMWLLCHSTTESVLTVAEVHRDRQNELEILVRTELFPALCARYPETFDNTVDQCQAALEYMQTYSNSIPAAVPSKQLGKDEWKERNGFFLSVPVAQPLHRDLLKRVGSISEIDIEMVTSAIATATSEMAASSHQRSVPLPFMGLTAIGAAPNPTTDNNKQPIRTALIVGGGILGSSIALQLARKNITNVTVVDVQPLHRLGKTTPASWAWLNANSKHPAQYAWLNQLGMDGWRRDVLFRKLPRWTGSLVRFAQRQSIGGGYRYEGPLGETRIRELEPIVNFRDDINNNERCEDSRTFTYYFPDEGLVDPSEAVAAVRHGAAELGVQFLPCANVTAFTREDNDGPISGVTICNLQGNENHRKSDIIVLAAGTGSAALGRIPLLHRPGQIGFASARNNEGTSAPLQRILVDTVRESHVLQRPDGTIVVGGGTLEVGGNSRVALDTKGLSQEESQLLDSHPLLETAHEMVPGVIGELQRMEQAVRPIPLDGLPCCGYIEPGLYAVVAHSGMTLAPILSALAAAEITEQVTMECLDPFQPTRFSEDT